MAIAVRQPVAGKPNRVATLLDSFRVALGTLRQNKLRSLLTMLGVIIGVCAVSIIVLINSGFQEYIKSEFASLSADSIFIIYDPSGLRRGEGRGRFEAMDANDREYLMERATKVKSVTGIVEAGTHTAKVGDKELKGVQVTGIEPGYYDVVVRDIVAGRRISQQDLDTLANVAIISTTAQEELFPNGESALGKTINLPGVSVTVVGIMKLQQQNLGPSNTKVLEMPVTTLQRKWIGRRTFSYMIAKPKDGIKVSAAMEEIWELLMRQSENKRIYRVDSSEAILGVLNGVIGAAGTVLAGVAALSLLVGGIGIMNIMLVSVTERTKEIGLRMALGARRGVILTQFLIEAAVLSLIGGLIGMGLGWSFGLLIKLITAQMKFPNESGLSAPFPLTAAIGAACFSALIGMVFGFFPAMSAARLDPIVALRKE